MQDAKQNSQEPHAETLRKKKFGGKNIAWLKNAGLGKTSTHRNKGSLFSLANARGAFQKRKLTFTRGICSPITT